ncbi:FAD binding domain-containing protein [Pseudomonas japonica]|uniref:FAD binding domain-containing protein n=1 Tax=Pseudomonas japonica TaxID=256466 RepID=UPI0015E27F6D|nr:xanthine dehydrogenase family protein subunit M [Pseudomonas japonica]MBA1242481.1 xanthine dehydrogenase family protein subunit M [Pseudomonas japonica]
MRTFQYTRADSPAQAIGRAPDANRAFLAGGTTLLDLVKLDVMQPTEVVDINRLALKQVERLSDGRLRIGALVTNSDLAHHPIVVKDYPVLSQALLAGASTQLRNKATTAGNVMQRVRCGYFRDGVSACNKRTPGSGCAAIDGHNRSVHAVLGTSGQCIATHPSDMCVAMAAIGATVTVQGAGGVKEVAFADFHLLPGKTPWLEHALGKNELITHITLDAPLTNARSGYLKLRDRTSYQFALASSAVIVVMNGPRIAQARVALGGVGTKPWRAAETEAALVGQVPSPELFARAAARAFESATPYSQNAYKVPLGQQAIVRNLRNLLV